MIDFVCGIYWRTRKGWDELVWNVLKQKKCSAFRTWATACKKQVEETITEKKASEQGRDLRECDWLTPAIEMILAFAWRSSERVLLSTMVCNAPTETDCDIRVITSRRESSRGLRRVGLGPWRVEQFTHQTYYNHNHNHPLDCHHYWTDQLGYSLSPACTHEGYGGSDTGAVHELAWNEAATSPKVMQHI